MIRARIAVVAAVACAACLMAWPAVSAADASIVEHNRADANQCPALNIATMQGDAMPHRHLGFQNCRMGTSASMNHRIVLNIRAIANPNVVHIAAQD